MNIWLIDTGPLVSYLDSGEVEHDGVGEALDSYAGVLATTAAVVTEAMHFIRRARNGAPTLSEFISQSGMRIFGLCEPSDIRDAVALMQRHADTPMDFADATLVLLAEELATSEILTLDRRGFNTYRLSGGIPFNLVLDSP